MIIDDYPAEQAIRQRYELLLPLLDERLRRLWAAAEAMALGTGGVAVLSRVTGLSRSTIRAGIKQLKEPDNEGMGLAKAGRMRKPGAGRKSTFSKGSRAEGYLKSLIEDQAAEKRGPLVWTCKSLRRLADELSAAGYTVSYRTVSNLLRSLGYSFGRSGDYKKYSLADRREGFYRINQTAAIFLKRGDPVLSVRFQAPPAAAAAAAAAHIVISGLLSWWRRSGLQQFPQAQGVLLTAESAVAGNAWTAPLEAFATETRLEVSVAHFPPGAWRWQRSVRQITCDCSLLEELEEVAEIAAVIDLVLPGV